ncbi:MFS transporter [Virgisporangium aliadipatigenens]|uniref:MFS transporter n=1 Tax=Virgisporangium aliadipatigenens TaxID=741659 RepID=A0A8J3YJR5_9ACTN|nr:MFS transporter [Virgisporangium aliadipatigenens]GIJ45240.1 MFS transporter [Virgisporangium aliadipatigenens]
MNRTLRAARLATFAYFALNGFVLGVWVVHIPAVEQRVGVDHAVLGWLLLLLGGGAFTGMRLVGRVADRYGARRVMPLCGVACGAALVLPAFAVDAWTLGAALLVLGIGLGALDVAMNAHAVQVERAYGRAIMSAFHAVFSVGGVFAALVCARTLAWGWSAPLTLGLVAALGVAASVAFLPLLLPPAERSASAATARPRTAPARIWVLAALAFALMLSEGVANDWSALVMRDVLDAPAATAAFAYGAFSTTMTVGRFLADRIVGRFGPVAVLRWGSALAALALVVIVAAPSVPVALFGWALFGAGLSGTIPQLFSAAGHADPEAAGNNVSRVAGLGYLGMLAGPAVIGPLTHLMPLNRTLVLPLVLCVVAALAAHSVRTPETGAGATDQVEESGTATVRRVEGSRPMASTPKR